MSVSLSLTGCWEAKPFGLLSVSNQRLPMSLYTPLLPSLRTHDHASRDISLNLKEDDRNNVLGYLLLLATSFFGAKLRHTNALALFQKA